MHAGIQSLGTPHPPDKGVVRVTRPDDPVTVGLTRLGQGSGPCTRGTSNRSLNLELMTLSSTHRVRSRSALPRMGHASGSLVHGCPDWGEPGRRDRHDQDSHVTSNTPPRSNIGSVMIGHAGGTCDRPSYNCIVLHLQVLSVYRIASVLYQYASGLCF
jgi:hypothetical protein